MIKAILALLFVVVVSIIFFACFGYMWKDDDKKG